MYRILVISLLLIYSCNNSTAPTDCAGVANGTAVVDDCGVCGGNNASQDCAGVCSGTATEDYCDDCESGTFDCAGTCNGNAELSGCDNACGSTAGFDCTGVCGGSAMTDCIGVCNGGHETVEGECVCNGSTDNCGVCNGDGSTCSEGGPPECVMDCSIFQSEEEQLAIMIDQCGELVQTGMCGMCVVIESIVEEDCHDDCDADSAVEFNSWWPACQSCPNYVIDNCDQCDPCGDGTANCPEWLEDCPPECGDGDCSNGEDESDSEYFCPQDCGGE